MRPSRSPHAHARIASINTAPAAAALACWRCSPGKDVAADKVGACPVAGWSRTRTARRWSSRPPILVADRVRHVGDQVAMVVAETRAQARAALALIEVEYEPLPAVASFPQRLQTVRSRSGIRPRQRLLRLGTGRSRSDGKCPQRRGQDYRDRRLSQPPHPQRHRAARATIGQYESGIDSYTLYTSSQNPHLIRLLLGAFVLGLPEHRLRVVAPGRRRRFRLEDLPLRRRGAGGVGRKESRSPHQIGPPSVESFMSDAHGRDVHMRAAWASQRRRFLGLHVQSKPIWAPIFDVCLVGAHLSFGDAPGRLLHHPGHLSEVKSVFTNTVPVDAYRGAGRPESAYLIERLVDKAARELGMDRLEIRRKNFITQFPYKTPVALEYDAGDYHATLDMALRPPSITRAIRHDSQASQAARGKLRGIGFFDLRRGLRHRAPALGLVGALGLAPVFTSRRRCAHPTGSVTVFTGTHSHGRGHETTFAQLVADQLGVRSSMPSKLCTATPPASRSAWAPRLALAVVGGSAIVKATDKIIAKGKKIAAHLLEGFAEADIEFQGGKFTVVGTGSRKRPSARSPSPPTCRTTTRSTRSSPDSKSRPLRSQELHLPRRLPRHRGRDRSRDRRRQSGKRRRGG